MKFYQEITIIPNHEIDKNFILARLFYLTHLGLVEVAKIGNNPNKSNIAIAFPDYQYSENIDTKKDEGNKNTNNKNPVKNGFGSKVRLFAKNREDLENFNATSRFSAIIDYVKITEILEVPASKINSYAVFMRHQEKTNLQKLSKRYLDREQKLLNIINNSPNPIEITKAQQQLTARQNRRQNLDINQFIASEEYNKKQLAKVFLPYINVKSNDKNSPEKSEEKSQENSPEKPQKNQQNYFKLWVKKIKVSAEVSGEFSAYGFAQNLHGKGSSTDLADINQLPTIPEF
jgi:CRISPR-associated endoribonuclease Cas6/Csy4 subtype I-F